LNLFLILFKDKFTWLIFKRSHLTLYTFLYDFKTDLEIAKIL